MNLEEAYFTHVVATAKNNVIGAENKLPWHIPEDLKFFQDITKKKALIMGRKTLQSLGEPLPDRLNVVITRQKNFKKEGVIVFHSILEAMNYCKEQSIVKKYGIEIPIIGGAEIYKQTLPYVKRIYLTRIYKDYEGDAFYPNLPENQFKEVERKDRIEPVHFSFLTYDRVQ